MTLESPPHGDFILPTEIPKIYPITDTEVSGLPHAEQVRRLAAGGARFIQIRDKNVSGREFYESALSALEIARSVGVKIIINDRVDIALAIRADGVHLGQDDLPPAEARKILGENAIVGFSTHTVEQALAAANEPIDYIAIGPIYPTTSKTNPDDVLGISGLKMVRQAIPAIQLVAIGGITHANISDVFATGADSAAVISYLLNEPLQITEKFQMLHTNTESNK